MVDAYIAGFPRPVQDILTRMRAVIKRSAPDATERISYRIPTFVLHGNLVHFAAFEGHVSFFPTSSGIRQFQKELASYSCSRGTVHFPMGTKIPYGLIARIVKFRVKENLRKSNARTRKHSRRTRKAAACR